jgi:phage-related minor tail protein
MLAEGGFVTQPTLAIIGEAGPEAVMPLSRMGTANGGGFSGQQIVVNINGGIFPADQSAIKQIGDLLAKTITQNLRVRNYQP